MWWGGGGGGEREGLGRRGKGDVNAFYFTTTKVFIGNHVFFLRLYFISSYFNILKCTQWHILTSDIYIEFLLYLVSLYDMDYWINRMRINDIIVNINNRWRMNID